MDLLLQFFAILPLAAFFISLALPSKKEVMFSRFMLFVTGLHLAATVSFIIAWLAQGFPVLDAKHMSVYKSGNLDIFINFYFDGVTAVFALVGALLVLLVTRFSRYYLHRDEGFKRYFSTILLFLSGYNLIVYAGNFETLFVGWEFLGVCSFLLIAFYRDRYLPVKNGLKVLSFYRFGDVCLILAMWMSHHLWHMNVTFGQFNDTELINTHFSENGWYPVFIALMIVTAAIVKSAQFPFSTWLPRAMEGPTTSSAIFYGSLSVHLGVFLLLRTYPYWDDNTFIKAVIIIIGVLTAVVATSIARVQSTVKTQIAYSSVAQIGLMFIEVAVGWHVLALVHFAGNAFLRTYQLLVSPSVLGYLIHDQFFNFIPKVSSDGGTGKLKNTWYMLSLKEWNLDGILRSLLWDPFKWLGNQLNRVPAILALFLILFGLGVYVLNAQHTLDHKIVEWLPLSFSIAAFLLIMQALSSRGSAIRSWALIVAAQLFIVLSAASLNAEFSIQHIIIYLSGVIIGSTVGFIVLTKVAAIDRDISLNRHHGYAYEKPLQSFIFLLSALALAGLPFTPTFIGIDILFSSIHKYEKAFIFFTALSFIFMELAILRIYVRIFLGPHKKLNHPVAFRSS